MNDDKLCISPDALIAMIVTEAQDRALAQMSGPEAAGDVQPSDAFLRKMDALVRNTRRKADRKRHLRAAKRLLIALAVQWRFSPAQCCPSRPCGTRLSKH